jgi:serine/threonine protein kinase
VSGVKESVENSESLLAIATALADGTAVDWESVAQSLTNDDDLRVLAELRFIAGISRTTAANSTTVGTAEASEPGAASPGHGPGDFWGPLKIIEHVGRGTFGDVYRAWDSRLDREVALKILRRMQRDDQNQSSTLIQEGRLLARVRHPNVVTVYGAERVNGEVGVWMEFVHGRTLEEELRASGPFAADRAIQVGIELSGALSAIHRAGLIHRDVKAQNVLCDRNGRLVLTDFGAGCEVQDTIDGATRELAGTPVSLAPEVLEGQAATPQTDVYSLGVLLFHVLTGTYPVRGRTLKEVRDAHTLGKRTALGVARPDLPNTFVRVIERAIDPDPTNRYDGPEALGSELTLLLASSVDERPAATRGGPTDVESTGVAIRRFWASNRRWWLAPVALALLVSVSLWLTARSDAESTSTDSLNPEVEFLEVLSLAEEGRLEEAYERALRFRSAEPKSLATSSAVAYTLTYAGRLDDAVQALEDVIATDPDYIKLEGWWAPTAFLYQRRLDQFVQHLPNADTPFVRVYRALAELEGGRRGSALTHLTGIEPSAANAFNGLGLALHAALSDPDRTGALVRSLEDQRRIAGDRDGEVTFKQAQILSLGGDTQSALAALGEAVAQGFVCVACFETSLLLEPVRALPGYRFIKERALDRQHSFGRRFGFPN